MTGLSLLGGRALHWKSCPDLYCVVSVHRPHSCLLHLHILLCKWPTHNWGAKVLCSHYMIKIAGIFVNDFTIIWKISPSAPAQHFLLERYHKCIQLEKEIERDEVYSRQKNVWRNTQSHSLLCKIYSWSDVPRQKQLKSAMSKMTCNMPAPMQIVNWMVRNLMPITSLSFDGHFPSEPGLASVYWSKGWWKWWWQLEL